MRHLLKAAGAVGSDPKLSQVVMTTVGAIVVDPATQSGITLPEWLVAMVGFVSACAMVFGGVVPFIPQYIMIRRSRSFEGFNTMLCLNLMMANILRIMFWFGHRFELPLLAQSVLMVSAMLYMMHACVEGCYKASAKKVRIYDGLISDFWKWTDYADYLLFTALFTVFFGLLTWLMLNSTVYIETLGFMAVFIEAVQAMPQWYRNHTKKSTQGMSVLMVASMTCGDTFKTGYFIARSAPLQFAFCGMLQVCIDLSILVQVFMYRERSPPTPTRA